MSTGVADQASMASDHDHRGGPGAVAGRGGSGPARAPFLSNRIHRCVFYADELKTAKSYLLSL